MVRRVLSIVLAASCFAGLAYGSESRVIEDKSCEIQGRLNSEIGLPGFYDFQEHEGALQTGERLRDQSFRPLISQSPLKENDLVLVVSWKKTGKTHCGPIYCDSEEKVTATIYVFKPDNKSYPLFTGSGIAKRPSKDRGDALADALRDLPKCTINCCEPCER